MGDHQRPHGGLEDLLQQRRGGWAAALAERLAAEADPQAGGADLTRTPAGLGVAQPAKDQVLDEDCPAHLGAAADEPGAAGRLVGDRGQDVLHRRGDLWQTAHAGTSSGGTGGFDTSTLPEPVPVVTPFSLSLTAMGRFANRPRRRLAPALPREPPRETSMKAPASTTCGIRNHGRAPIRCPMRSNAEIAFAAAAAAADHATLSAGQQLRAVLRKNDAVAARSDSGPPPSSSPPCRRSSTPLPAPLGS